MASNLTRDANYVPGLGAVDSSTGKVANATIDHSTGGLDVNVVGGGSGGTQYTDGGTPPTHPVGTMPIWNDAGTWKQTSLALPLPTQIGDGTNTVNILKSDGTAAGQNAVITAGTYKEITGLSATGTGNLLNATDVSNYKSVGFQLYGTYSASVVAEGSNDGTNWYGVWTRQQQAANGQIGTMGGTGMYYIPSLGFRYLRLRVSAFTSGTVQAIVELYTYQLTDGNVNAQQVGTWTVGSNSATGSAVPANAFFAGGKASNSAPVAGSDGNLTGLWVGRNGQPFVALTRDDGTKISSLDGSADGQSTGNVAIQVGDYPFIFNGTNWDRQKSIVNATNSTGTGIAAVGNLAQFDDVSPTSITENQFGNLRMSANRNLYNTIRDAAGNERGANVDANNNVMVSLGTALVAEDQAANANRTEGAAADGATLVGNPVLMGMSDGTDARNIYSAKAAFNSYSGTDGTNLLGIGLFANGGGDFYQIDSANPSSAGDGWNSNANGFAVASVPYLWNGASADRQRGNVDTTTGDTPTITTATTTNGATQTNYNFKGAYVVAKLGTVTGTTPTLKLQFQYSIDGGTTWLTLGAAGTSFTISTGGTVGLIIYPAGAAFTASLLGTTTPGDNIQTLGYLPRTWRVTYITTGTGSLSIPISACYVQYLL